VHEVQIFDEEPRGARLFIKNSGFIQHKALSEREWLFVPAREV